MAAYNRYLIIMLFFLPLNAKNADTGLHATISHDYIKKLGKGDNLIRGIIANSKNYGIDTNKKKADSLKLYGSCALIDYSRVFIDSASCNASDGNIIGITGTGTGTLTFKWYDQKGTQIAEGTNITNVPAGYYLCVLYDQSGCLASGVGLVVPVKDAAVINNANAKIKAADCYENDGAITNIATTNAVSYQWLDSLNNKLATTLDIGSLTPGEYTLVATNKEGCSTQSIYTVPTTAMYPAINKIDTIVSDCGQIDQLVITFKLTAADPVYSYTTLDAGGDESQQGTIAYNPLQPTGITINLIPAVKYKLVITDPNGCATTLGTYSLPDTRMLPPVANNVTICLPGSALITVNNAKNTGSYTLYDSTKTVVSTGNWGRFAVNVTNTTSYYISYTVGGCESPLTKVTATVAASGVEIPNAFTPNGDGINDYWNITGIENLADISMQIFDRYGQKVFESKGYAKPFDGTYKGKKLPAGVYYYIINLNTGCNPSGSLTIIR
jgi:gliding motility-associated-like protein